MKNEPFGYKNGPRGTTGLAENQNAYMQKLCIYASKYALLPPKTA